MPVEPKTYKEYEQALRYCDNRIKQLTGELNKHGQEEHELRLGLAKKVASGEIQIDDPVRKYVLTQGNNFMPFQKEIEDFYREIDQKIRSRQNKLVLFVRGSEHEDCTGRGTTTFEYDDFFLGILSGEGLIFDYEPEKRSNAVRLPTIAYVHRHGSTIAAIRTSISPMGGYYGVSLNIYNFISVQSGEFKIIPPENREADLIIGKKQINKLINENRWSKSYRRMIDEMTEKLLELIPKGS